MIHVRTAIERDAGPMAELLNEIIEIGGTTAMTKPVSGRDIENWMEGPDSGAAWYVAVDDGGEIVGFQWIHLHEHLPPEAADIATFVKVGKTGLGIGSDLFKATQKAAETLGYTWINAAIRADNSSGLAYYASRGFAEYGKVQGVRLESGLIVDQILTRYTLNAQPNT